MATERCVIASRQVLKGVAKRMDYRELETLINYRKGELEREAKRARLVREIRHSAAPESPRTDFSRFLKTLFQLSGVLRGVAGWRLKVRSSRMQQNHP